MLRILHITLLLCTGTLALAQLPLYHAQVFGAEQGIGNGTIQDQTLDQNGFLWITFNRALQRFDGRSVKTFQFDDILQSTLCDAHNRVWTITQEQIFRIKPQSGQIESIPLDTSGGLRFRALFQLKNTPLRLLTTQGVWEWQEKTQNFKPLKWNARAQERLSIYRFDTCGSTFFYADGLQICAFDVRAQTLQRLPGQDVYSIYALTPDLVVVNDYQGKSYWYNFAKGSIKAIESRLYLKKAKAAHIRIYGVIPLSNQQFLMSSFEGLFRYDLSKDVFYPERVYAAGKPLEYESSLQRLIQISAGKYWAHIQTAVVLIDDIRHTLGLLRNHHSEGAQMWQNRAINLVEDAEANIWFGTGNGFTRLNQRDASTHSWWPVEGAVDRLAHGSIRGLSLDKGKVILAPTNFGMWIFDPTKERYERPCYASEQVKRASEQDFFDGLYALNDGRWLGLGRDHLYVLQRKNSCHQLDFGGQPTDQINTNVAQQDGLGRIWVGTQTGVYVLNEDAQTIRWSIPFENAVLCFFEENEDRFLIGTNDYLLRLTLQGKNYRLDTLTLPIKLHDITQIFRDRRERIWIGADNGLIMFDRQFKNFRRFDFADNVQSIVFSGNAFLRARNGLVFMGGPNGINYFYPENFELFDAPLNVSLASLDVNNGDSVCYDFEKPIQLCYWQNMLTLEALTPYFNNAARVQYRYRITSLSIAWINNGNEPNIRLSGLAPGTYRIEVAASILGRQWFKSPQVATIVIRPPWWATWPFKLFALGAILILSIWTVRRRELQLKQRQKEKLEMAQLRNSSLQYQLEMVEHKVALSQVEKARQKTLLQLVDNQRKAAEAKLKSMRLQMNPHFLFNALNSIQQMVMVGQEREAALYLSKFSRLLRMVLTHSDREKVALREEIEMLELFVALESLRFDASFQYKITCADEVDVEEYLIPTLLIQPFVENAIWHGLLHREGIRKLTLHFSLDAQERLCCSIRDNGIGRAAAQQLAEKRNSLRNDQHTGKGLSTSQERITTLNEQTQKRHELLILDLYDEQGAPQGTEVLIFFDV